jgi:hypothetical protein
MNIRPVEPEFFHADGRTDRRTDMTKLIAAFRYFAKAPKQDVKKTGNLAILYQKLPPVW